MISPESSELPISASSNSTSLRQANSRKSVIVPAFETPVNGREWKSVVRFKLGGVDDVRKRDGAPVKHFGIGVVCDILLVHIPDIVHIDILNTIAAVQQIRMDCGFLFQRQRNFFFGNSHVL